jgi:hypothetical protein
MDADAHIMAQVQRGEREAFEPLVRRFQVPPYAFFVRLRAARLTPGISCRTGACVSSTRERRLTSHALSCLYCMKAYEETR